MRGIGHSRGVFEYNEGFRIGQGNISCVSLGDVKSPRRVSVILVLYDALTWESTNSNVDENTVTFVEDCLGHNLQLPMLKSNGAGSMSVASL